MECGLVWSGDTGSNASGAKAFAVAPIWASSTRSASCSLAYSCFAAYCRIPSVLSLTGVSSSCDLEAVRQA